MKKGFLIFGLLILLLILVIANILISTGFFRKINNTENYEVIAEIPLKGAEDFSISYSDGFMLISQDDRAARRDGNAKRGNIYLLDLKQTDGFEVQNLTEKMSFPFYPHGLSLYKLDSGRYQVLVINHAKGHSIEEFTLWGDSLVHEQTFQNQSMISPNDVIALDENAFYFTNDHGNTSKLGLLAENYLGLAVSNVVMYRSEAYQEVANNIAYANGINVSADRKQLLVASPRDFQVNYYDIMPDGLLVLDEQLAVGTGVDNIELDEDGNLWIGSHPNLLAFTAYASGKKPAAPSEIIKITPNRTFESLYENDGALVSASSVAAPYKDLLFVGTVMDDLLLVLRKKSL